MSSKFTPAVGIDLGTTFSVVAHLDVAGRPVTIPNSEGELLTPSVVLFDGKTTVVGKEAVKASIGEADRVAEFVKRDIGNSYYSRAVAGERFPPEVLEALILEKLKRDAQEKLGAFEKVVITVPAFFNEPRRKATQDAGQLAGLDVLGIINEPTAAAIAYGYEAGFITQRGESREAELVLVYDLGGGTFDVTLMEIAGTSYRALATDGDVHLGGIDWDQRIVDVAIESFSAAHHGIDPRSDPRSLRQLQREAEDAKRTLSAREQTTILVAHAGYTLRVPISRREFEERTADLLERTRFTARGVLQAAGKTWKDVTRLLAVGGSTRMPMVRNMLEAESGLKVNRSVSADEAVAHGAALYAGLLLSAERGAGASMSVCNVSSHDLGVLAQDRMTRRRKNSVIIPRNTPLPATRSKRFRISKAGQKSVPVHVIEGVEVAGSNSAEIGRCVIHDLPGGMPVGAPVDVKFTYNQDGRLTVTASLPEYNREAETTIERSTGLSEEGMQSWGRQLRSAGGPLTVDSPKPV